MSGGKTEQTHRSTPRHQDQPNLVSIRCGTPPQRLPPWHPKRDEPITLRAQLGNVEDLS